MQTTIKKSVLVGVGLLGISGLTQAAELTANVGVTSNYVFRGATQTDDGPAVQGGVDYTHDSGLYAGAWASNVEITPGDNGFETDLYAGYNFKLNEAVTFDVGYIAYLYHSTNDFDASEIYFGASFKDFTATYYVGSTDGPGNTDYNYVDLKYSLVLPQDFTLHLHYGNMDVDVGTDYEDASIGISKKVSEFDIGLTATTIDYDGNTSDENEIFVTATKTFKLQ